MLKINDVSYCYEKDKYVLKNVNLTVEEDESVGIIGANGAGKSTLFSLICGLDFPSEGNIEFDGCNLSKKNLSLFRKNIGMVFQNPDDQLFMPTVFDDVAFSLRASGMEEKEVEERAMHVIKHLNIESIINRPPYRLSGGEKRRAAIAGAIALKPKYLLLDEPTAFLDPKSKREFIELFKTINCARIIASHDIELISKLCKRVVILYKGQVKYDGDTNVLQNEELLEQYGM